MSKQNKKILNKKNAIIICWKPEYCCLSALVNTSKWTAELIEQEIPEIIVITEK